MLCHVRVNQTTLGIPRRMFKKTLTGDGGEVDNIENDREALQPHTPVH